MIDQWGQAQSSGFVDQLALYDNNLYITVKVFLPPTQPGAMRMKENIYNGYANLYELQEFNGKNVSLSLTSEDNSQMIFNCTYFFDYQYQ